MEEEVVALDDFEQYEEAPVRNSPYEFDLYVIGGGSGGLACAKEAASLGAKVGLADFVKPTPQGTKWGLGGTCVNVGCIPKKLMHHSSLYGEYYEDQRLSGWEIPEQKQHNWSRMVANVQRHVKSLNWGYRVQMIDFGIEYSNCYASFVDPHTIVLQDQTGTITKQVTSEHFVIAVGGRPMYGDIPGAQEYCITSDDIFSMPELPENILVVGGSYVALECAGFLRGIGKNVTGMIRSIFLRGFDQQMAELVGDSLTDIGVSFLRNSVPLDFKKTEEGKIEVTYTQDGQQAVGQWDSVLLAIGRYAVTDGLNLQNAGVEVNPRNKKLICNESDQTNVPHIWGLGDARDGTLELTPVAIKSGTLLARRLFGNQSLLMDYSGVPTTVFTPLEYGCVGLTEEEAKEKHGDDNIDVYHSAFRPLEWNYNPARREKTCYLKLIVDLRDNERVLGAHYIGPNAGEVIQGMGIALKAGATRAHVEQTVGIHPTCAEEFTTLKATKRSGANAVKSGC